MVAVGIQAGSPNHRRDGQAPSRERYLARWAMITASILAIDGAVTLWIVVARSVLAGDGGVGGGSNTSYCTHYRMYDDSSVLIVQDFTTGKSTRILTSPATAVGLRRVWWPAVPAGILTLSGLALASTHRGRRYVAGFPTPRMTTGGLMIAVAVLGTEGGLAIRTLESSGIRGLLFPRWELTPILVDQLLLHALAFLSVGVALLVRLVQRRRSLAPPDAVTFRV